MKPLLTLGLLVGCAVGGWGADLPVAPAPREKPALKCELRVTGKVTSISGGVEKTREVPSAAVVRLTNVSGAGVDIGSSLGPFANLYLKVKDPAGKDLKTEQPPFIRIPSADLRHEPYILKPGESLEWGFNSLGTVPEEKRVAGTYKVKAVYTVGKNEYESDWVDVKWPGDKK